MKKQNAWVKNLLFVCKNFNGKAFCAVCIDRQTAVTQLQPRALRGCSCVTRDTDRLVRDTSYCIGDLVKFSTHEVEYLTVTEDQHLSVTNNIDSLNGGLGVFAKQLAMLQ